MTQIVSYKDRVARVRDMLERAGPNLALPAHVGADAMTRAVVNSVIKTPKLLDCSIVSLHAAVSQAAELGLLPGDAAGMAYLIPFGKKVQFVAGYRGLLDLARRSGKVTAIYARVVHEADEFDYQYGLDERCTHKPSDADDPGPLTHAYAVAVLTDGSAQFEVMTRKQIEDVQAKSRAGASGPWKTDKAEMWKKSALRRLCKVLPMSPQLHTAVTLDEMAERGIEQKLDTDIILDDEPGDNGGQADAES